jgi:hypothetical protein
VHSLGPQTPIEDIRRAALAHDVQVVALSFSGAFPVRQAGDGLAALRRLLPPTVAIWAGGEMTGVSARHFLACCSLPTSAAPSLR